MMGFHGMPRRGKGSVLISVALVAGTLISGSYCIQAKADAVSDLQARLQTLNAGTPVSATLMVQSSKLDPKHKSESPHTPVKLQMEISTANGLGIHLDSAVLQTINAEQQAHADDPEKPTPVTDLLNSLGPIEIERLVSAAPGLLRALDGASNPVAKPVTYEGDPVQELTVSVPLKISKKSKSSVSDYKGTMSVWLNAQGMPLAYRQVYHMKFCKFFLCVSVDETRNAKLKNLAGRLVAMSYTDETRQSGLGQDGDNETSYSLVLDNTAK